MDGVTIVEIITVRRIPLAIAIFVTIMLMIIVGCQILPQFIVYIKKKSAIGITMGSVAIVLLVFLGSMVWVGHNTYSTEYIVTIDDDVPYKEFVEKYEVIAKDEDQYRVREVGDD